MFRISGPSAAGSRRALVAAAMLVAVGGGAAHLKARSPILAQRHPGFDALHMSQQHHVLSFHARFSAFTVLIGAKVLFARSKQTFGVPKNSLPTAKTASISTLTHSAF
jgi:hypothetical protein